MLKDYLKGDASTPMAPGGDKSWTGSNPGPYLGIVKGNQDPARMGRLKVFIPSLAKTSEPNENQLITCDYLAPFYGAKGNQYTNGASRQYEDSQHSYGFWAVPPDIDTKVLVIFAEGKMEQAYWIGCVQDPFTNHMVPGIASSTNTWDTTTGQQEGPPGTPQASIEKKQTYGTDDVPAGELNRNTPGALTNNNYEATPKPIHPLADVLLEQGLIKDNVRGTTTSSARRETPSQVFGISTPGRKNKNTRKRKVGAKDSELQDHVTRGIGHTFVMDDGDIAGDNQLTRIRTASGHQLLMHDTDGVVYLANGSGKAFIEMEKDGTVNVYSESGINLRTSQDFNLHSDRNINFHSAGNINFTSENNVNVNSEGYVFTMGQKGILSSSQAGAVRTFGSVGISSYTNGTQLHGAGGRIDLAGSQVHFNSVGARSSWGPTWLKPDAVGIKVTNGLIDVDSIQPIKQGEVNKKTNKTTVSEFVTHEPYDRKSSTQRKKELINEMVLEIKNSSPGLSATELTLIKKELEKQPSVAAVSEKFKRVVKLNDNINVNISKVTDLANKAKNIDNIIKNNVKNQAMNFVQGQIASAVSAVRSFFRF